MSIKPVLVPDHDAAELRKLMDSFAEATAGPTRRELTESRAAVAKAQEKLAEGSAGWMLRQDPELAKKVRTNTQGYKDLKKMAGKTVATDKKDQKAQSQQQAGAAFGSMFGGDDPAASLKIREQDRPDVMRHAGDKTIRVVKKGGKPIGEIGTDAEASPGNGPYYVKLYDGSYDAVGFDTAEEALAELKYAVKQMAEGSLTEFAPSDSGGGGDDDGFDEDTLRKLAAQWFAGDEDPQVERLLAAAGWEIGQDEGYDDEPGVFVVMSGDDDGRSYISWPAEELRSAMSEGVTEAGAENNPVVNAITRRIMLQRTDLLSKYGPEKIGQAVDEVADFVGDVEEIGSSDVSGWVRHVEQMLGNMESDVTEQQVDELSPKTLGSYIKKSSADAAERQGEVSGRNQFGKGAEFAVKAFYGDQIQPNPTRTDPRIAKRQAGVDQAVDRLTAEDVAESRDPIEQLRADIQRFAR